MKIGIIGSGVVGQTLAAGFLKHGHEVEIGTRDPAKLKDWAAKHPGIKVKTFAEAAAFGDVVVLAVAGQVALEAVKLVGPKALSGKTVIDACNPIGGGPPVNGVLSYFTTLTDSLMERLQKAYPEAHFVKAFNSVGNGADGQPAIRRRKADHVHLRQRRRREKDRDADPRPVRLGYRGHGRGRGGPRHRAALHALVHPRRRQGRLVAACVQAVAGKGAALAEPLRVPTNSDRRPGRQRRLSGQLRWRRNQNFSQ